MFDILVLYVIYELLLFGLFFRILANLRPLAYRFDPCHFPETIAIFPGWIVTTLRKFKDWTVYFIFGLLIFRIGVTLLFLLLFSSRGIAASGVLFRRWLLLQECISFLKNLFLKNTRVDVRYSICRIREQRYWKLFTFFVNSGSIFWIK